MLKSIFKLLPENARESAKAHFRALLRSSAVARGYLQNQNLEFSNNPKSPANTPAVDSKNPLESYFDLHTQGKGIWKWEHYFDIYHSHFSRFTGREVHVLEVGVYGGGALQMWQNYFGPSCHIYGVDIDAACKSFETDSVKIFIGDQADRDFWNRFKKDVPILDIVIDDGGHEPHQQIATLEELLPHIRPGGVYVCEDVHGADNEFADYISGLSQNLNAFEQPGFWHGHDKDLACRPTEFQSAVRSVHLYPFVTVIEKADRPIKDFYAPRHGTEWPAILEAQDWRTELMQFCLSSPGLPGVIVQLTKIASRGEWPAI